MKGVADGQKSRPIIRAAAGRSMSRCGPTTAIQQPTPVRAVNRPAQMKEKSSRTRDIAWVRLRSRPSTFRAAVPGNCYVASSAGQEGSIRSTPPSPATDTSRRRLPQPSSVTKAARFRHRCQAHRHACCGGNNPRLIDPASLRVEAVYINFTLTTRPTLLGGNTPSSGSADAASDEALWSGGTSGSPMRTTPR